MRTTVGDLVTGNIYAFVYGAEGVGKTLLPMTLANNDGLGVAYITAEKSGPTSLISAGYPGNLPVEVLPDNEEPFDTAVAALNDFASDKSIHCICLDGLSVMSGAAIDFLSDSKGEKALGYDGWAAILSGFRRVEAACNRAFRQGKSVVLTAWEAPPTYEDTLGGQALKEEGRPWLQGKAKYWMPGKCDIVARMTSTFRTVAVNGKATKQFEGKLHLKRGAGWVAKSRWDLPDPCPADLQWILSEVKKQAAAVKQMDVKQSSKAVKDVAVAVPSTKPKLANQIR